MEYIRGYVISWVSVGRPVARRSRRWGGDPNGYRGFYIHVLDRHR